MAQLAASRHPQRFHRCRHWIGEEHWIDPLKATDSVPDGDINPLDSFPRLPDGKSPDLTNWFHYEGSLTSEPYSEDVSWFVMKNESKIDPNKLEELEKYAEQEARPTYALDRRIVVRSF